MTAKSKPPCKLSTGEAVAFSILFRVRDVLRAAGRDDLVDDFLDRAAACGCCQEIAPLANEYVEVE